MPMNLDGEFELLPPALEKRLVLTISEEAANQLIQELGPHAREMLRTGQASALYGLALRAVEAFVTQGTCQHCGCTDEHACLGGCSWVDDEHTLCSVCADAI